MRFHHSTRRGRVNRLGGAGGQTPHQQSSASRLGQAHSLTSRWAQLSYCRQTNIHFNRRLPVEPPASLAAAGSPSAASERAADDSNLLLLLPLRQALVDSSPSGATNSQWSAPPPTTEEPLGVYCASPSLNGNGDSQQQQQQQQLSLASANSTNEETPTPTTIREQKLPASGSSGQVDQQNLQIDARLDRLNLNDSNRTIATTNEVDTETKMQILAKNDLAGAASNNKPPTTVLDSSTPKKQRRLLPSSHNQSQAHQQQQQQQHYENNLIKLANKQRTELGTNRNNNSPARQTQKLDMEFIRQKLIAQVEKHPFWSNKAAKRMNLTHLDERRVFVYQLISYCERRDLEWRYEPYRGGLVAGSTPFRRFEQQRLGASSSSQPTTPTTFSPTDWPRAATTTSSAPANDGGTLTPTASNQKPFSYRMSTLQVPHSSQTPDSQLEQQQHQFVFADSPTNSNSNNNNKSPIRRSCSSAASSPIHHQQQATTFSRQQNSPIDNVNSRPLLSQTSTCSSNLTTVSQLQLQQQQCQTPSAELVWSIEPPLKVRPAPFVGYLHSTELPDSSFVKQCHGCQGRGRLKCTSCHGVGYEVCISCSGKGTLRGAHGHYSGAFSTSSSSSATASRSSKFSQGGGIDSQHQSSAFGSMWDSADQSGGGGGSKRYDEPGGVTQGGSSSGWTSESCHFCHGAGQKRCWICAGRAYNSCLACAGTGQLRCYLNLNITWINHRDEHILNNSDSVIPKERLRLSSGLLILDETGDKLKPVDGIGPSAATHRQLLLASAGHGGPLLGGATCDLVAPSAGQHQQPAGTGDGKNQKQQYKQHSHPNQPRATNPMGRQQSASARHSVSSDEANQLRLVSSRLLEKHQAAYKQERLLKQRQKVTQIECYIVNWEWKRRRGHFVIYGDDRKVYIAKYPFKSICNIT